MAAPDSRETCCSMISQTRVANPAGHNQNGGAPCSSMTAAKTGSSKTSRSTASRKVVSSRWVTIGLSVANGTGPKFRESVTATSGLSETTHAHPAPTASRQGPRHRRFRDPLDEPEIISTGMGECDHLADFSSSRPGGDELVTRRQSRSHRVFGDLEALHGNRPAGYGRLSKSTTKECHAADNDCPRPLRSLLRGV